MIELRRKGPEDTVAHVKCSRTLTERRHMGRMVHTRAQMQMLRPRPVQVVRPMQRERGAERKINDFSHDHEEDESIRGDQNEFDESQHLTQEEKSSQNTKKNNDYQTAINFQTRIVWFPNVLVFIVLHSMCFYGMYLACVEATWKSWLFAIAWGISAGLGVTAGAHRLWSHRSYKARTPLRILLMIFNCMACQNDIYEWCRDHRVHHKYSETNADPHNVNRGFFFAHVGWLMCKKHPDVIRKGASVSCADLLDDPVVRFQRKYYIPLTAFWCFGVSTALPLVLGESLRVAYFSCTMARYVISLNFTWLVNSAAHLWGTKPYNKWISPVENTFVTVAAIGEGFHNFHHTFPYDYRTSEFGMKLNLTTAFINLMARCGQAYDLKTVPADVIEKRSLRTGDGSRE
ncbi:acyl-CoA desaturase 1-like [Varroa jacobsoni]|uniref:acyl-CoA desaturase 1-like n=1 Tax=Varroa jacobsoni TaxID=62625 RepID=UPI000BF7ED38|nr:acyl-CoA desaturase 1-like [Varroa jacobsoni]